MPTLETGLALYVLWAAIGYLLGSIPFGLLLTKALGLGNLREIGSGNIGATNVLRTGNKGAAAATLLLDGAKGAVAVLLAREFAGEAAAQIAALAAFLGHCFPIWLGFKGGKGVATFLGLMLALAWPVGLLACATWLATAVISRISSLSALVAASWSTLWCLLVGQGQVFFLTLILALLIIWRHRENLARLKAGTEPRIGGKKA
ncbi:MULTISPECIES: glycerol-3-phosphate 1-O-acyltransferase PlsY [Marivita]|uniref:Glycerol-3-phosphate acyltransferase n=1 Tax=Marivita cryptomonadis TaxID=505252 RepID=A0A9Q2NS65_9RHOB|nr:MULTISPECIES: glycerol-3-phosphate 1-O-acyltransferase PlsY [Marivita]MCR9169413.1 glycerol-3-phosphate 1-O-acyltransferase PlsY [Paracoccaceae bacterium]MBM2321717.1 glycerol-3-phosphate 1-O-acyltransferase PlsY [Marivita cryptomonadis]MBM2331298.1 glycerol-3-phosphate 1-O-acyltransferase PlsY [Marivita cryptomonadis]MBM2340884.1 glycerol-3-phosphate 1-O-acyltransferase PlsY [Marivita cryptomonadis]MBM2345546.1 glycerol-3-phosphate 1-O-acyltransferase PlsY [Marivita cryptomonadis]